MIRIVRVTGAIDGASVGGVVFGIGHSALLSGGLAWRGPCLAGTVTGQTIRWSRWLGPYHASFRRELPFRVS